MAYEELKKAQFKRKGMSEADATAASMKVKKDDGKLVDMKRSKEEKSDDMPMPTPSAREDYPYGLSIEFDDDMMSKLDMDMPAVGSKVKIVAEGVVKRAQSSDHGDGEEQSCCVQIQKMKVT